MNRTRPSAELIAARKWEISRRYDKRFKVGKRSRGMAAIRVAELTKWLHHVYGAGVELEPSARSETVIRIFAHHLGSLPDAPRRITKWTDTYAPWISPRSLEIIISDVLSHPLKWSADKLAWKLGLTDAMRTELNIKTIGAIDCNAQQRAERRKQDAAARQRARRADKRKAVHNI